MNNLQTPRGGRARARLLPLILAAGTLLAACDGDNAFPTAPIDGSGGSSPGTNPPPGNGGPPPDVAIQQPTAGSLVAVGDSVFVRAHLTHPHALGSLELSGFALRGRLDLGTQVRVERFEPKTVEFKGIAPAVTDTVITRYLIATPDSLAEADVFLVALARDTAGNERADTLRIAVGGPSVHIDAPLDGVEVRAGVELPVRIRASDRRDRIQAVRLRASGAVSGTFEIAFNPLLEQVDTVVVVPIPSGAEGPLQLEARAVNALNMEATGRRVTVGVLPPSTDQTPPTVTFVYDVRQRAERNDTLRVQVGATDDTRVDTVGVSVVAHWGGNEYRMPTRRAGAASRTFHLPLHEFGLPVLDDTMTVSFEITAFARDAAGNCAAATVPGVGLVEPCRTLDGGHIASDRAGARAEVLVVRGRTVRLGNAFDRIADIASDGRRVFLSNFSRNRVDVLPIGGAAFGPAISVGSEPWGLALDGQGDTLYVANSGGTNISVVPIPASGTLREARRIQTADIRLYDVTFDVSADTASLVMDLDYSDRPQFLGRTAQGRIVYSTKPTPARADGTVRILDPVVHDRTSFNRGSEIFVGYALHTQGKATVVNALSAGRAPEGRLAVCPRPVPHSAPAPDCIVDLVTAVRDSLQRLRANGLSDTRVDWIDAGMVGLSDTTFVAVSGDRRSIAFGEGAVELGRVMLFHEQGGTLTGSTTQTRDLLGNASERVIGLGLNQDGSLGVARGNQVYYFNDKLRLQGMVRSGSPAGGIALHPSSREYGASAPSLLSFASGFDEKGHPYIDVIHTYSFRTVRRIYVRDGVTGSLIMTQRTGTSDFYVHALTAAGVVEIRLGAEDLDS